MSHSFIHHHSMQWWYYAWGIILGTVDTVPRKSDKILYTYGQGRDRGLYIK